MAEGAASICTATDGYYKRVAVGGGYQISPIEWNSQAPLCMSSTGGADFTVTSSALTSATDLPVKGAPGAYARIAPLNTAFSLPASVAGMGDTLTSWRTTEQATGKFDASYDLWYADDATGCTATPSAPYELMIWLNAQGGAVPYGDSLGSVAIGTKAYSLTGHLPDSPGDHKIINYQLSTPATSVYDLNLRTITADAVQRGFAPATGVLCSVQAGFEIWDGGAGLATTSFSYQPTVGLPTGHLTSSQPGQCLDAGKNTPPGTAYSLPVDLWDCTDTANQSWTIGNDGTIKAFGKCLDVKSGGTTNGTPVQLYPCNSTGSQLWQLAGRGLRNPQSGLCLADLTASTVNGTQLVLWICGTASQQWRLPYDGEPIATAFTNGAAQTCLSNGIAHAGSVDLRTCTDPIGPAQNWQVVKDGTVRTSDQQCLDAVPGSVSSQILAQTAPCTGSSSQQWLLQPSGYLLNMAYGRCLDDPHSTTTQGTAIQLYICNGTDAQVWYSAA